MQPSATDVSSTWNTLNRIIANKGRTFTAGKDVAVAAADLELLGRVTLRVAGEMNAQAVVGLYKFNPGGCTS